MITSSRILLLPLIAVLSAMHTPLSAQPAAAPTALLDRTIARMGGDSALRAIRTVRLDVMTQWARTSFANRPFTDQPSYERNVELRDYASGAWRNTRNFFGAGPSLPIVDVVRDTIAVRYGPTSAAGALGWVPLNVAYVAERRELFAMAPERLVLSVRHAPTLRTLADTTVNGESHARFGATIDGWPVTLFVRRIDALPTLVRFRADEVEDFGLAPWGRHEVEFWYSGWQPISAGVLLPRQRDVRRVGRPYKRMTVLGMQVNAPAPSDSFAISDSLMAAYLVTERRPMWQVDVEKTGRMVRDRFAVTPPITGSPGAVRLGGMWILFETAQHEGAMTLIAEWLGRVTPGVPIGAGIATMPSVSNGGARWFADARRPLFIAPGAAPFVQRITGRSNVGTVVSTARWVRMGSDSLWIEPFDAPDISGALAIYSPTLRWLYLPMAGAPNVRDEQAALTARLAARGLPVEWIGSVRALVTAVPPAK